MPKSSKIHTGRMTDDELFRALTEAFNETGGGGGGASSETITPYDVQVIIDNSSYTVPSGYRATVFATRRYNQHGFYIYINGTLFYLSSAPNSGSAYYWSKVSSISGIEVEGGTVLSVYGVMLIQMRLL